MITAGAVAGVVGIAAASAATAVAKDAAEMIAKDAVAAGYFVIKSVGKCTHSKCSDKPLCKHPREVQGWLQPETRLLREASTLFITRIDKQKEKAVSERRANSTHLKSLAGCEFIYLDGSGEMKKIQFVTEQQFKKIAASQVASAAAAKQHEKKHTHHPHTKHQAAHTRKEENKIPEPPSTEEVEKSLDLSAKPTTEKEELAVPADSAEKLGEKSEGSAPQAVATETPALPTEGILKRFISFWLLFGWFSWLVSLIRPAKPSVTA